MLYFLIYIIVFLVFRIGLIFTAFKKQLTFLSLAYTGTLGFFLSSPLVFYDTGNGWFFWYPIVGFVLAIIGFWGLIKTETPFFQIQSAPVYVKNLPKSAGENLPEVMLADSENTSKDNNKLVFKTLINMPHSFSVMREINLDYQGNSHYIPIVVFGKTGLFLIYPSNFEEQLHISDYGFSNKTRFGTLSHDTRSMIKAENTMKTILDRLYLGRFPIRVLIVPTTDTLLIHGFSPFFEVVPLADLEDRIIKSETYPITKKQKDELTQLIKIYNKY
jgi:hypothetical protein